MISQLALGASVFLFIIAAADQLWSAGNIRVAALYACFALTNTVAWWIGTK